MRRVPPQAVLPAVTIGVAAALSLAAVGGNAASIEGHASAAAGSRIAFASWRGSRNRTAEIYVMRADGTGLKRLTRNGLEDDHPAWSPDGRKIAFQRQVRRNGDDFRIYVVSAAGGRERALTPSLFLLEGPAWSPNGRKIAFAANNNAIWIMNADGSARHPLKVDPAGSLDDPAWSPDGTRIAFMDSGESESPLYVMNADGSGARPITTPAKSSFIDYSPAWSPNGRTIAFTRDVGDGTPGQIRLVSPAGGNERLIARNGAHPSWSPDGRRIVFDGFARYSNGFCNVLYLVRADGSRRSVLRPRSTRDCINSRDHGPAWHR